MHYLTLIYHLVQTRYEDNEELTPLYDGEVLLVRKQLAALTLLTEDITTRHMQKLVKKDGGTLFEAFMEMVEEVIFSKGWTEYTDWANVHDILVKKGQRMEKEEEGEVSIEEEERREKLKQEKKEEFADGLYLLLE